MCPECYVVLEAYNEGQVEECPKCGGEMQEAFLQEET